MSDDPSDPDGHEERERRVLSRVLRAAARAGNGGYTSKGPRTIIRRVAHGWKDSSAPGVRFRVLWQDEEVSQQTILYQMDAGTSYPAHVHAGAEECYVIQGDLRQEGLTMSAGDYQRVEAGSQHGDQHSDGGCLLFIRCSTEDYPVPEDGRN